MANKPLIRWIIGPAKFEGFCCLKRSITKLKTIYPEFDLLLCHNQLNERQLDYIKTLDIPLFDQNNCIKDFPVQINQGYHVHRKLYPPRIRPDSHEIVIDNDIVLFNRIQEIDLFIQNDAVLLYQGLHGLHGQFGNHVPPGLRVNSGIFGMPPGFDFLKTMNTFIDINKIEWKDKFDEQGLVAATLLKYHTYYMIPLTTLPIVRTEFLIDHLKNPLCCGFHFVSLNYCEFHKPWKDYLHSELPIL